MDAKLRILVRQYTATGDPALATQIANNLIRASGAEPPRVWQVLISRPDVEAESELFYDKGNALRWAVDWIEEWLSWNTGFPYWEDMRLEVARLVERGQLEEAVRHFNGGWIDDHEIAVSAVRFYEDVFETS